MRRQGQAACGRTGWWGWLLVTMLLGMKLHAQTLIPTTTTISDVVNPIHYGEVIGDSAKALVTPTDPAGPAVTTGTLRFYINGQLVCTLPVDGSFHQCPDTTGAGYPVGTYQLVASYSGSTEFAPSSSIAYEVDILPDDTTGGLMSSLNPSTFGQAVTFTATFSSPYAVPNGTVTFYDGATVLGTGTLDATGAAAYTTAALAVGSHNVTASYPGNGNFNGSTTPVLVQVVQPPVVATTMTIGSSANPSTVGTNVTFTVVVTGATTTVSQPAGPVTFTIDGVTVSTVTMTGGTASYATSTLALGNHTVAASYAGGTTTAGDIFSGSTASLVQEVDPPPPAPSFTLTVTPAALSVPIGSDGVATVTVTGMNGFVSDVTLACGNLPREVTCTFNRTTIHGSGTATLLVHATAPHDCGNNVEFFHSAGLPGWLGVVGITGLFFAVRRRRMLLRGSLLALVLVLLGGCSQCTDLGVKPGNYSFTVTGTSGSETHTLTVQMVARL